MPVVARISNFMQSFLPVETSFSRVGFLGPIVGFVTTLALGILVGQRWASSYDAIKKLQETADAIKRKVEAPEDKKEPNKDNDSLKIFQGTLTQVKTLLENPKRSPEETEFLVNLQHNITQIKTLLEKKEQPNEGTILAKQVSNNVTLVASLEHKILEHTLEGNKEYQKLKVELEKLNESIETLKKENEKIPTLEEEKNNLNRELEQQKKNNQTLTQEKETSEKQLKELRPLVDRNAALEEQTRENEKEITRLKEANATLQQTITHSSDREEGYTREKEDLKTENSRLNQKLADLTIEKEEMKTQLASLKSTNTSLKEQLKSQESDVKDLNWLRTTVHAIKSGAQLKSINPIEIGAKAKEIFNFCKETILEGQRKQHQLSQLQRKAKGTTEEK